MNTRASSVWILVGTAALMALSACDNSSTEPEEDALVALAELAATDADSDVQQMRSPGIPGLRFPGIIPGLGNRPECPAEDGGFHCRRRNAEGLDVVQNVTFFDESGTAQAEYDEQTTASVTIVSSFSGTMERGPVSRTVDRSRDFVVTGLLGAETRRVWNGTSEGSSDGSRVVDEVVQSRGVMYSSVIEDVIIADPREPASWPLGGVIRTTMDVVGGENPGAHNAVVTFDGSQFATVEIDGVVTTVDLATRRGRRGRHP
jgi:hypothetical protein